MNNDIYYVDGILDGEFTISEFAQLLIEFKGYAFYTHSKYGLDVDREKWVHNLIDFIQTSYPELQEQLHHQYIWTLERHLFVIGYLDVAPILNKSPLNY